MAYISRDSFAREEIHRTVSDNHSDCEWCGRQRIVKGQIRGLYRYETQTDGGRTYPHKGLFCSKSCHDAYHMI